MDANDVTKRELDRLLDTRPKLTFLIPFTQYVRPNGQPRQQHFEVTGEVASKAATLVDEGARFSAELTPMDMMALYGILPDMDPDEGRIFLIRNGPEMYDKVAELVEDLWKLRGNHES